MKITLAIASFGFLLLIQLIPYGDALRLIMSLEELSERSDAIAVGTVQSTWVDIRPFDEHPVVDTAKIQVDNWFKNNKNSEALEIRYYGYWAKTIDDWRGVSIFDNPVFDYTAGQKVLVILDHEDDTAVMGGGYYPFFEGSFVISGDIATSQNGDQIALQHLYGIIDINANDQFTEKLEEENYSAEPSVIIDPPSGLSKEERKQL